MFTLGSINIGKHQLFADLKCLLGAQLGPIQRHTNVSVTKDQAHFLERLALGLGADKPNERDECQEAAEVDKDDSGGPCQCLCVWGNGDATYLQPMLAKAVGAVSNWTTRIRKYDPMAMDIPFPRMLLGKISVV